MDSDQFILSVYHEWKKIMTFTKGRKWKTGLEENKKRKSIGMANGMKSENRNIN